MKPRQWIATGLFAIVANTFLFAQSFTIIPLGVRGGSEENNLSAYMLAPAGSNEFICLDAGTIHAGIEKAIELKSFTTSVPVILKQYIKGYFISHGHLDHLAGMILNSPDDSAKSIYAMPYVLEVLKEKYFSWKSWANFADEGEKPVLGKYHYVPLDTTNELTIANTSMYIKAFPLAHSSPYQSSAGLIRAGQDYVLYFGDTGADTIEHSSRLRRVWREVAPLIKLKRLKGIFIEVSFPDEQPDKLLFGHLTPRLLMQELNVLADYCKNKDLLRGLPIIITHMKPVGDNLDKIVNELQRENKSNVKLIFPSQGKKILL